MSESQPPKLFVSYCWSSPDHVEWVLALATNLRSDGVDVKLDKWDLKPGHDALAFMEGMVADPEIQKVLIISDARYAERANQREGGVGIEAQIISPKIYESTSQEKFAAILLELDADGRPILPHFLASRIYFDFTNEDGQSQNYDQILRWIFDRPVDVRPPIGNPPVHLRNSENSTFSTIRRPVIHRRFASSNVAEAALEALESYGRDGSSLVVKLAGNEDQLEAAYNAILATVDVREDIYSAMKVLLREDPKRAVDTVHSLLESLLRWSEFTPVGETYSVFDNDAVKFLLHECFVGFVAMLLAESRFVELCEFLNRPFYLAKHDDRTGEAVPYPRLRPYLESLDRRNKVKNLRRLSLHADIISETHQNSLIQAATLMEADLILHVRGLLDSRLAWYPVSGLYLANSYGTTRLFIRAQSKGFYSELAQIFFGLDATTFSNNVMESVKGGAGVGFDYRGLNYEQLLGLGKLSTLD